jgi:hypothetical protein
MPTALHPRCKSKEVVVIEDHGYATTCWVWQLSTTPNGYAKMRVGHSTPNAHRYFYQAIYGKLKSKTHLDHLCRVRACIRPDHLQPVTIAENVRRGVNARLEERDRERIFELRSQGLTHAAIGALLGVGQPHITRILNGLRWGLDNA